MPFIRTLPTVVTVHDLAWHRVQAHTRAYARTYFGTLQARAYAHAAAIICDSQFSANEYNELIDPNAHVDVVYPGVDERFSRIARNPDESPFALVVGTVETRKNLGILVDALTTIPSLRIVSTGPRTPYADEVRRLARNAGVSNRLELRGYVTRDELDHLYARAACALIPSRYEGFGYALAEAMCAGVPAIAASSSSLIEVANAAVPLVSPDDANAWTEAIRTLLADRPKAESNATALRPSAQHRFSWSTAATNILRIYKRITPH
jgi:glycosyltransferase involved in cell wall biosynthesis